MNATLVLSLIVLALLAALGAALWALMRAQSELAAARERIRLNDENTPARAAQAAPSRRCPRTRVPRHEGAGAPRAATTWTPRAR